MHKDDKIQVLESLRGVAALFVAIYHFRTGSHFDNAFTGNAWLMVDFFFVLSGFVIALNYQGKLNSIIDLYNFQIKRLFRLYPLHILMLIAFLAIECAKYVVEYQYNLVASSPAFSKNDLSTFMTNIFLVQNFVNEERTWNFPSWSISAEFYTYIIFAILVLLSGSRISRLIYLSLLIVAISFFILIEEGMWATNTAGPTRCLYGFFLGVITLNIYKFLNQKYSFNTDYIGCFFLAASAIAVINCNGENDIYTLFIPVIFMFTILTLVMSSTSSIAIRSLGNKYLVYLGTISYGVYMIHGAVWWCFTQICRFILKFPVIVDTEGSTKIVFESTITADFIMISGIGLIIYLAHVSYRFIEMPLSQYHHKIRARPVGIELASLK